MSHTRMTTLLICLSLVSNMSPDHNFTSFLFPAITGTIRNILMILGRIIKQVSTECCIQE